MFKFFPDDDNDSDSSGMKDETETSGKNDKSAAVQLNPCKEILIGDFHSELLSILRSKKKGSAVVDVKVGKKSDECLTIVNLTELSNLEFLEDDEAASKQIDSGNGQVEIVGGSKEDVKVKKRKVMEILTSASDLVPGEYEGGFKTWECTFDLLGYIKENFQDVISKRKEKTKGPIRILDMGCGSGLVGLGVLRLAEKMEVEVVVDFQDYNDEVINYVTIPNTLLSFKDEMASRCRFFAGDWDSFREVVTISTSTKPELDPDSKTDDETSSSTDTDVNETTDHKNLYDLILSSETIYNLDYFPKILRVVQTCLKRDTGSMYLAAKTVYFGVGGGTKAFLNMVNENGEGLEASVIHVIKQGVQREILKCQYTESQSQA